MVGLEDSCSVLIQENTTIPFPLIFRLAGSVKRDEQQMGWRQQPKPDPVPVPSCASEFWFVL